MSEEVRKMFSDISGDYDLLNDLLSFGRHRNWKKSFVRRLNIPQNGRHLDVATGTGDIAERIVMQYGRNVWVKGIDFSESMIIKAKYRKNTKFDNLSFDVGDATNLNFSDNEFDSVSISFGIRNIPELLAAISEMTRVIKPGGLLAIMEFGTPDAPFNTIYKLYSKYILPLVGKFISGNDFAYTYLPETIKKFPYGKEFQKLLMDTNNFSEVEIMKLEFGTVYAYFCRKKS